jgi:hypothetical protein
MVTGKAGCSSISWGGGGRRSCRADNPASPQSFELDHQSILTHGKAMKSTLTVYDLFCRRIVASRAGAQRKRAPLANGQERIRTWRSRIVRETRDANGVACTCIRAVAALNEGVSPGSGQCHGPSSRAGVRTRMASGGGGHYRAVGMGARRRLAVE